jgi:hypothetical protein
MQLLKISKSTRKDKKMMAVFIKEGKRKTVHFGASGYSDFTLNKDERRKKNYLSRHKPRENWRVPDTPGSLSRWILWNKKSLSESIQAYKIRFSF